MKITSIGFIGSGRVAAFMMEGFAGAGEKASVTLSDADPAASARRAASGARDTGTDFAAAAAAAIAGALRPDSVLVSLAPKVAITALRSAGGSSRIARFLPSAPSSLGLGYNPISFADELPPDAREALRGLLGLLGTVAEVEESTLEAYAVLCAMGPTYLWPILDAMAKLGVEFGLDAEEARRATAHMALGAAELYGTEGRHFAALMDMIPAKPMADDEAHIRELFGARLRGIHDKLRA